MRSQGKFFKCEFSTENSLLRIIKTLQVIAVFFFTTLFVTELYGHGTQVAYCVTTGGKIRVYIEHWHGNITPPQVVQAPVTINVLDTSTGMTSTFMSIPDGVVWDTPVGSLPDCKGPLNVISSCPGRANVYNDWVYWEFTPPACFINLRITVVEVTGSQSWYFDEACAELYPVTFEDSFIDCVPPTISCPTDLDFEVNTTDCNGLINSGLEPTILFDDCTPAPDLQVSYTITGATMTSGTGNANGNILNKGTSTVMYNVRDNSGKESTCSFNVTVDDTTMPVISCPPNLNLECGDPLNSTKINEWLQEISATDICGIKEINNSYNPNAFASMSPEIKGSFSSAAAGLGHLTWSYLSDPNKIQELVSCKKSKPFTVIERSGNNLYDYRLKVRVNRLEGMPEFIDNYVIVDQENRIVPMHLVDQSATYFDIWIKIPELLANSTAYMSLQYGQCSGEALSQKEFFDTDISIEQYALAMKKPSIHSDLVTNAHILEKEDRVAEKKSILDVKPYKSSMVCNCTATQGSQSFNINAIQNAEDDVSFYQYGTPNVASANTGLECSEAVVLFLYENTLTGEISLFILIDDAGDPTGGRGSIDFFCLSPTATLDFSDDPGEISGIFPTVTANWRWAPCCTDGALIGNVGCNTTFDFYPNFTSGINTIKWATGSLSNPTFLNFNSTSEPVRISCGTAQPSCCPNENTINITNISCPGENDGAIDLVVDPNGMPYSYLWSTGDTSQDIMNLAPNTYTVSVTDNLNCEQVISVDVSVENKPSLSCPSNISVEYTSDQAMVQLPDLGYAVDYDCTNNTIVTCIGCGVYDCIDQNMTIPVMVVVEDELGNQDQCTISVLLENSNPQIVCPNDLNLECEDPLNSVTINNWLVSVESSSEDIDDITNNYDPFSFFNSDQEDLIYNSSGKQSVQNKPRDSYFTIGQSFSLAALGGGRTGSQVVTFTAEDLCGNVSSCQATITISDTLDPILSCPEDITIECGDANSDAIIDLWLNSVSATDQCNSNVVITNNFVDAYAGGCNSPTGSRTVTFTGDDGCGNTATCTSALTVVDTQVPEFLMKPRDITVSCTNAAGNGPELTSWLNANGGGMAVDDCDRNVTWASTLTNTQELCGYTKIETYTFTIEDDCGLTSTATATFTVEDETPPILSVPADQTVNCAPTNETQLTNFLATVSATDVCTPAADVDVEIQLFNTISGCGATNTRVYLITATDECGNSTSDYFSYTIEDPTDPTWSGLPGTLTLECGDIDNSTAIEAWLQDIEDATFDGCGGPVTITHNWNGNLAEGCNQNTTISFTVTDDCGNSSTFSRIIEIRDRIAPVFLNCPTDMTVNVDADNCDANVIYPIPVGSDQCAIVGPAQLTLGLAPGSTFPLGATTIRYQISDDCRVVNCTFRITVVDSDIPTIDCPSNDVTVCVDNNRCDWLADDSVNPLVIENCAVGNAQYEISGATTVTRRNGDAEGVRFSIGNSRVCYYVSDLANNEASCCFDVIVEDCQDPSITCPMGTEVTCVVSGEMTGNNAQLTSWLNAVSAADNCTTVSTSSRAFNTISGCGNTESIVYEFTATDPAGNQDICYSTFTVIDTVDPVITTMASNGISNCDDADADLLEWLNIHGGAEANDECGEVAWSHEFVGGATTGCSGMPSLTVEFTATDECGNASTTQAEFRVDDNIPPSITCPEDITLECGDTANDGIINLWLLSYVTSDNCSDVTVINNYTDVFAEDCGVTGANNVTFTATDNCGNTTTCTASLTINDSTVPEFVIRPQDLHVECDGEGNSAAIDAWLSTNGGALVNDNCDSNLEWAIEQVGDDPQCGNTNILEYNFIIIDDCDNTAEAAAFVYIEDTTAPTVIAPGDLVVECDGAGNEIQLANWLSGANATDICSEEFTFSSQVYNTVSACGGGSITTYIFTGRDDCGNESTAVANFTISDTAAPSISCPEPLTIVCGGPSNDLLIGAWLIDVTGSDLCSDLSYSHNYTGLLPENCGGSLTVTFTATDDCGNTETCMADIIMIDNISPDFLNCSDDIVVNVDTDVCGANPVFSDPIAVDNCDVTVLQTDGLQSGATFRVGVTYIEYVATDECMNTATCGFNITVVDSDVPTILCPSTDITACIDPDGCVWTSEGIGPSIALENCGYTLTYTIAGATTAMGSDDASGEILNTGEHTICYTILDENTNSSTCCFDVVVFDCEEPKITCPDDITVICNGMGNDDQLMTWLNSVSATDNCQGDISISHKSFNNISNCGDTFIDVYEFIAQDQEGNSIACYASFAIEDSIAPIIDVEAQDLTVECDGSTNSQDLISWLNDFAGAVSTDACGDVVWSHDYTGDMVLDCGQTGSVDVVFTAMDDCGNTSETEATFTIVDTTNPEVTCPADITIECSDPINEAVVATWLTTVDATDICSDVDVSHDYPDVYTAVCGTTGVFTVTFTAVDICQNIDDCTTTITIEDTQSPILDIEPQDRVVSCSDPNLDALLDEWLMDNGGGLASDACDTELDWSNEALDPSPNCGSTSSLTYTFSVEDDCGNVTSMTASFITQDLEEPVLTLPVDITVECNGVGNGEALSEWLATVSATDNCSEELIIENTIYDSVSECGGGKTEVYQFEVTDACGNTSDGLARFTIEDTTEPAIVCPQNLQLECGAVENDQMILAWLSSATVTDDCSQSTITPVYPGGLPMTCEGSLTVEFVATDACDNTSACESMILMNDTTEPVFVNCPEDITINVDVDECGSNPIFSTPHADDNCEVSVTQTAGLVSGSAFPLGVNEIEFTAIDTCRNTAICQFSITVIDSDEPMILCPSTAIVFCTDQGSCTWASDRSIAPTVNYENCPDAQVTYVISGATEGSGSDSAAGEILNLGSSTICYTIVDGSDNQDICCFEVIIEDCEDPTLLCPGDMIVECANSNGLELSGWLNAAVAEDNCDVAVEITTRLWNRSSSCGNTNIEEYLFTAMDNFGNETTCIRSFEIQDNTAPVITTSVQDKVVECDGNGNAGELLTWLENNGNIPNDDVFEYCNSYTWQNNFETVSFTQSETCDDDTGFYEVRFWVVDECSNISNSIIKRFIIEDTRPPKLTVPADITLACDDDNNDAILEAWINDVSMIDICDSNLELEISEDEEPLCGLTSITTYMFTVVDHCGNSATDVATVTIQDIFNPTILGEAQDLVLECASNDNDQVIQDWLEDNGMAIAADGCSESLDWSYQASEFISTCGSTGMTLYTFTVVDECGNQSVTTANVILLDTTPPALTVPEDQIEECGLSEISVAQWQSEATAMDECSTVTIDVRLWNTISGCGGEMTEEYQFIATDACGNQTTEIASYQIVDTNDPEIICPDNLALTCGDENNDQIIIAWLSSSVGIDLVDCSGVSLSHDYPGSLPSPLTCNEGQGIVVTFTATDECSNSTNCTSTITMDDEDAPYFLNCPDNLTVNVDVDLCETNVVYSTPVALDNCDETVFVELIEGPASGTPFDLGVTVVTFEAIDECRNTSTCTFMVTVIDSSVPSIHCPSNTVVVCVDETSCTWNATSAIDPIFNDNCDGFQVTYTVSGATEAEGNTNEINSIVEDVVVFNLGTSTICYTIVDPSDNGEDCCFDIIVEDCEDPIITCSDRLDVACGDEDLSIWFNGIAETAMDNCNSNMELQVDTLLLTDFSSCGSTFERVYQYTVTDLAGNLSRCTAIYETDDTTPPIIVSESEDLIIECDGSNQSTALQAWLNDNGGAAATDDCSEPVVWTNDFVGDLSNDCGATGEVTVTFTATDNCGNMSTTSSVFRIEDNVPPVLDIPQDIVLQCGDDLNDAVIESWLNGAVVIDACQSSILVTHNFGPDVFEPGCGLTGVYTVTWTAIDACDNTSTDSATITIEDTVAPPITSPAVDLILECADPDNQLEIEDWIENVGFAEALDNCIFDDLVWTFTISPEVEICGDSGSTRYTFIVTDNCGNQSTTSASIIIQDNTPPLLVLPADQVEQCGEIEVALFEWQTEVSASDDCGDVSIEIILWNTISGCGSTSTEEYLFIATDECGNETRDIASYTIEDTTDPIITQDAEPFIAECNGGNNSAEILNWLNNNGFAEASDNCDNLIWANDYGSVNSDCGSTGEVEVTFTATDRCGNASSTSAMFTILDTTPPTWEIAPTDINLECTGDADPYSAIDAWLSAAGNGEAEDECSFLVYTHDFELLEGACGLTGSSVVTFTATDACGNSTVATATVSVVDNEAPVIISPAKNRTVECNGSQNVDELQDWLDESAGALAEDHCTVNIIWEFELVEQISNCGGTNESLYIFTATDDCGNTSAETEAYFTIIDNTSPDISGSSDLIVECNGIGNIEDLDNWLNNNGGATATDICSDELEWTSDLIADTDLCASTGVQEYLFTVTDACGNTSTSISTFTIEDTTAPLITSEAETFNVECDGASNAVQIIDWLNNNGRASATDDCTGLVWSNNYGEIDKDCGSTGETLVTFTVTDACGNSSSTSALFNIDDSTPPTWEILPTDLELECNGNEDPMNAIMAWLDAAGNGEAEDECSFLTYTNDFTSLVGGCSSLTGSSLVTFTAIDACSNTTNVQATVTVKDDTPPSIISDAQNIEVECDGNGNENDLVEWLSIQGGAVAADICSETLIWDFTLIGDVATCGTTNIRTYAFAATDECGNTSTNTIAAFIIIDETSPRIGIPPTDIIVECDGQGNVEELNDWLLSHGNAMATDDCSEQLIWESDLVSLSEQCGQTNEQVYRFTVYDDCGNASSSEASFIIEDTTSPQIFDGEDRVVECDASEGENLDELILWIENRGGATAQDDCGLLTWKNDYDELHWEEGCNGGFFVDVVFTVTDACDNTSSITLTFGNVDLTPPTFVNCPRPPVVVDAPDGWCNSFVNFSPVIAEDNCNGEVVINQIDNTGLNTGDLFPVGLTVLTFEAVDECNNRDTCELKIIVNDFHTPPTIECGIDQDLETDPGRCTAMVSNLNVIAEDNCSENISILYEVVNDENIITCGFDDASGNIFPTGTNTVQYTVFDQPILLITEIIQDGATSGIEITNFGPSSLDISCLQIGREGASNEVHDVPNDVVLSVGDVYTHTFSSIPVGTPAGYYVRFLDWFIDGVSMNGYTSSSFSFTGMVAGSGAVRQYVCDHDDASDFTLTGTCVGSSFGVINDDLPVAADNGNMTSLQGAPPSEASCNIVVDISDTEAPFCARQDTIQVQLDGIYSSDISGCQSIVFNITENSKITDVNILDFTGSIIDLGALSATLTSPTGTTIQLLGGLCAGSQGFDLGLDDDANTSVENTTCNSLSNSGSYQPVEELKNFFGENARGDWGLDIYIDSDLSFELTSFVLEIIESKAYRFDDVIVSNDPNQCGGTYSWQHPFFSDNCCLGTMSVQYSSDDDIELPQGGDFAQGEISTQFFGIGTTVIIYQLQDASGNTSSCSFEVTVADNQLPTVNPTSCDNFTVNLGPGECTAILQNVLPPLIINDNCGAMEVSLLPDGVTELVIGDNPVTIEVFDPYGNLNTCVIIITVVGFEDVNNTLACYNDVNLSIGSDCTASITADQLLGGSGLSCPDEYCVIIHDEFGDLVGSSADGTNIFSDEHVGQTFAVSICESCDEGANCCWGFVHVEKKFIPELDCPVDITVACNESFDPIADTEIAINVCKEHFETNYFDDFDDLGSCNETEFRAKITRNWTVTEKSGATHTCAQMIWIEDIDHEDIVYPEDMTIETALTCKEVIENESEVHPDSLGYPTINDIPISNTGEGLCMHTWNYEDQVLHNCLGSYEILRTWIVRDMCEPLSDGTNGIPKNPWTHTQIIKVFDNTAPVIENCPPDITVSSDSHHCYATVDLDQYLPDFYDECGEVSEIFVSVSGGTVIKDEDDEFSFTLQYLEKGDHNVAIKVRDYCSNVAECSFTISVEDLVPPVAICDQHLVMSLSGDGRGRLNAESIDDGSFDNCSAIEHGVIRMEDFQAGVILRDLDCDGVADDTLTVDGKIAYQSVTCWPSGIVQVPIYNSDCDSINFEEVPYSIFAADIEFCCDDVFTNPNMVMYRVWDDGNCDGRPGTLGDNFSTCMVEVEVNNKLKPSIVCPPDLTLTCTDNLFDMVMMGEPTVSSICDSYDFEYMDINDLSSCGHGTINRNWRVVGFDDVFCDQYITIELEDTFNGEIDFPDDVTVTCLDAISEDVPQFDEGVCDQVGFRMEADTFLFEDQSCFKIIKKWEVINWCTYDVTTGEGLWSDIQIIKVIDESDPEIVNCEQQTFDIFTTDCLSGDVQLSAIATDEGCGVSQSLEWTWQYIENKEQGTVTDEGILSGGNVTLELSEVPVGHHSIIWTVTDACNNRSSCEQDFTVRDAKAPQAVCLSGISTSINDENGEVVIWASDLNNKSLDECTMPEDLLFSFVQDEILSSRTFTCTDITNGIQDTIVLEMWVTDLDGNQSNCTTELLIQDLEDFCTDTGVSGLATIGGEVTDIKGAVIPQVEIRLEEMTTLVTVAQMVSSSGIYSFVDNEMYRDYKLTPSKDDDLLQNLSTYDLVKIQKHIQGIDPITDPYALIAADINNDGRVSVSDLLALQSVIVGVSERFPNNTSWVFMDRSFMMDDLNFFMYPDSIMIDNLGEDSMKNDFMGIKVGDVSSIVDNLDSDNIISRDTELWQYQVVGNGGNLEIFFYATQNKKLKAFELEFEVAGTIRISDYAIDIVTDDYNVSEGNLMLSWIDSNYVDVKSGDLLFSISIHSDEDNYNGIDKGIADGEIVFEDIPYPFNLRLQEQGVVQAEALYQNEPNPFKIRSKIDYHLIYDEQVTFEIYDSYGILVTSQVLDGKRGKNTFEISSDNLKNSGVYFYRLVTQQGTLEKSMILIE